MLKEIARWNNLPQGVIVLEVEEFKKMATTMSMQERHTAKLAMQGTVPPHQIGTSAGVCVPIMQWGEAVVLVKLDDLPAILQAELDLALVADDAEA